MATNRLMINSQPNPPSPWDFTDRADPEQEKNQDGQRYHCPQDQVNVEPGWRGIYNSLEPLPDGKMIDMEIYICQEAGPGLVIEPWPDHE